MQYLFRSGYGNRGRAAYKQQPWSMGLWGQQTQWPLPPTVVQVQGQQAAQGDGVSPPGAAPDTMSPWGSNWSQMFAAAQKQHKFGGF